MGLAKKLLLGGVALIEIGCGSTKAPSIQETEQYARKTVDQNSEQTVKKIKQLEKTGIDQSNQVITGKKQALLEDVEELYQLRVQLEELRKEYARPMAPSSAPTKQPKSVSPKQPNEKYTETEVYGTVNQDSNDRETVGLGARIKTGKRLTSHFGAEATNLNETRGNTIMNIDKMILNGGIAYNIVNGQAFKFYVGLDGKFIFEEDITNDLDRYVKDTTSIPGVGAKVGLSGENFFIEAEWVKYFFGEGQHDELGSKQVNAGAKVKF